MQKKVTWLWQWYAKNIGERVVNSWEDTKADRLIKVFITIIILCTVQKWDIFPRRLKTSPVSGKVRQVGASISVGADTCERLEPLSIEVYNKSWILCTEGCSLLPIGVGDLGSLSLVWVGAHKFWILESPHIYVKDWLLRSIGIDFFFMHDAH